MAVDYKNQQASTVGAINAELEKISVSLEDALSLSGNTPNAMQANLDMNSNRVLNLASPTADQEAATKKYVDDIAASGTISTSASNVTYDNTSSGLAASDVQAAIDEVDGVLDEDRLKTTAFQMSDGMFSWWARPMLLRYTDDNYNRTYQVFTEARGAVGILIHNHDTDRSERYVLDTDRVPDDHNSGTVCVGDGKVVVAFGGRSNTTEPETSTLICGWDLDDSPEGDSFYKYYLAGYGRDYPNLYQYDNDAILMLSQRDGDNFFTGTSVALNSWPLDENGWSAKQDLIDPVNSPTWTYVTTRRNTANPNIIDLALGFHPQNQPEANIYKAQIRHVGGTNPWRLYSNGVEIGNISTGANLPVLPSDLELAYDADTGSGEKTRLFDVKNDGFIFASYFGNATTGVYKYTYKSGGVWNTVDIDNTGEPFYASSRYFGGGCIDEVGDTIYIANEENSYYRFKEYKTEDNGASWSFVSEYSASSRSGAKIIQGRPLPENASLSTLQRGDNVEYVTTGWIGRYNEIDFGLFNSNIITLNPVCVDPNINVWQQNVAVISAEPDEVGFNYQASIASINGKFQANRSGDFASSGIESITKNSAGIGSRNCVMTGATTPEGLTDYWQQVALASNESTVGKTNSAVISSDQVSIDVGASINVIGNTIISSGAGTSISDTSSYSVAMSGQGNTLDGDFGMIVAGSNNTIDTGTANAGYATIASSLDSTVTASRGVVVGSDNCSVNSGGAASGIYHSSDSSTALSNTLILAGSGVQTASSNTIVTGNGATPSTANRTLEIDTTTGDITIAGTLTDNNTFADIAKMLENGEGEEIESGYLLTLIGNKVYKAKEGEPVDAIVAATPSMVHNDTPFHWQGRYLTDDFGKIIYEDAEFIKYDSYMGKLADVPYKDGSGNPVLPPNAVLYKQSVEIQENKWSENPTIKSETIDMVRWDSVDKPASYFNNEEIPSFADRYIGKVKKENPDYNPDLQNVSRKERPDEWTCAGVHGLIRTRVDNTVTQSVVDEVNSSRSNVFIKPSTVAGLGCLSGTETNVQVMAVEKEFNSDKGYGVALCLLR